MGAWPSENFNGGLQAKEIPTYADPTEDVGMNHCSKWIHRRAVMLTCDTKPSLHFSLCSTEKSEWERGRQCRYESLSCFKSDPVRFPPSLPHNHYGHHYPTHLIPSTPPAIMNKVKTPQHHNHPYRVNQSLQKVVCASRLAAFLASIRSSSSSPSSANFARLLLLVLARFLRPIPSPPPPAVASSSPSPSSGTEG